MSEDYYLAELLAEHIEDAATIAAVKDAITLVVKTDQPATPDRVETLLGGEVDRQVCETIVFGFENTGILVADGSDTRLNSQRLRRVTGCAEVLAERERPPENELVATVPEGETSIKERHFGPLLLRLRELIDSAEENIFLVTPFFSETIADRLVNPLDAAAERDVDITITTRYLTYGDKDYNREFVEELLKHDTINQRTSLYEYVRDVNDLGGTVHAKMLVIDDTACYLGTANLTHRGLRDNLELGILLRDESVSKLRSLVDSLQRSSLMHRVEYNDGEFVQI
jgi:phosphatidylserine/phosphatidylglycerophosphate/cardiolipin synthase-like enzyme